jgi:hypothetical protein
MQRILLLCLLFVFSERISAQDLQQMTQFQEQRRALELQGENYTQLEKQVAQTGTFPPALLLVKSNTSCTFRYYKYIDPAREEQIVNRIKSVFNEITDITLEGNSLMKVTFTVDFSETRFLEFIKLMGYEGYETK